MVEAPYYIVDVFAVAPFTGNPLAVFPDAGQMPEEWMRRIARELNLSETAFVTGCRDSDYDVRIFTPAGELPFAGHPTLGTASVLHGLGRARSPRLVQTTALGPTVVEIVDGVVWLTRTGSKVERSVQGREVARALGLHGNHPDRQQWPFGNDALEATPAVSEAGLPQLLYPVADPGTLVRLTAAPSLSTLVPHGIYCWTVLDRARVKARFFGAGLGVTEDPATGSAAAGLGLYIAGRVGEVAFEISQGAEIGRPSRILVEAAPGRVRIGGAVAPVGRGVIDLPEI